MEDSWTKLKKVSREGWHPNSESKCTGPLHDSVIFRHFLTGIIEKYKVKSIVDIGCGDLHWMKEINLDGIEYYGIDWILSDYAKENFEKMQSKYNKGWKDLYEENFMYVDIPKVDLIICKCVLIHMTNDMAVEALEHIFKDPPDFFLSSTQDVRDNDRRHIRISYPSYSAINLMREPFNFGLPLYSYGQKMRNTMAYTSLWETKGMSNEDT